MFNAASDWVGCCAITITRRLDPTPKVQSRGSDSARKPGRHDARLSQLSRCGKLDRPMNYGFFLRSNFLTIRPPALLPRLVAFARTLNGDAELARDLVQEAAARVRSPRAACRKMPPRTVPGCFGSSQCRNRRGSAASPGAPAGSDRRHGGPLAFRRCSDRENHGRAGARLPRGRASRNNCLGRYRRFQLRRGGGRPLPHRVLDEPRLPHSTGQICAGLALHHAGRNQIGVTPASCRDDVLD